MTAFVKAAFGEIAYEEIGKGPALLALHGGMSDRSEMLALLEPLQATRRIIAPDLRGHGESALPSKPWTYADLGADLLALVDALKLHAPDVCGYSDGANAALAAAIERPGFARAMVLAAPVNDASARYASLVEMLLGQPMGAAFDVARFERERAEIAGFVAMRQGDRWRELMPRIAHLWAKPPAYTAKELGRIRGAVTYVFGEDDVVPREEMEALARGTPGSRLVIMPGDHLWPEQRPEEFVDLVAKALGPG